MGMTLETMLSVCVHYFNCSNKQLTLEEVVFGVLVRIVSVADHIKRRSPSQHLKHQDAQRPPVNTEVWTCMFKCIHIGHKQGEPTYTKLKCITDDYKRDLCLVLLIHENILSKTNSEHLTSSCGLYFLKQVSLMLNTMVKCTSIINMKLCTHCWHTFTHTCVAFSQIYCTISLSLTHTRSFFTDTLHYPPPPPHTHTHTLTHV